MSVLFLSGDLVFASRLNAVAQAAGAKVRTVRTLRQALEIATQEDVSRVLLDLSSVNTLNGELREFVRQLRALKAPPHIVAYAPHVHVDKLAAATAAGCDQVLSRGQFDRALPELLGQLGQ
jgi:DNA-binding response OmpR family regulator